MGSRRARLFISHTHSVRVGRQRMRWWDGVTDSVDIECERAPVGSQDRGAWRAAVHGGADMGTSD